MDNVLPNTSSLSQAWGSYRRSFPSPLPLMVMGHLPNKQEWMRLTFGTCNFSLILRGAGEYWRSGRVWQVAAPCVITQWPGEHVEYGPSGPAGTWDELFLMYSAELFAVFQRQHLVNVSEPVWPILDMDTVERRICELQAVSAVPVPAQVVDCVDRLCELLILETHLPPAESAGASDELLVIHQIERELGANLAEQIDLEELAMRYGMSLATLRRRWSEVINVPPARYRLQVRLREACRLLTRTARPVYEIARLVGFPDELYFSRRFRQEIKVSPRAYRKLHQVVRGADRQAHNAGDEPTTG